MERLKEGRKIIKFAYRLFIFLVVTMTLVTTIFLSRGLAVIYYVRTDGNDANLGTINTPAGAWKTIQKAADMMNPGDTVEVQAGTYDVGTKDGGYNGGGIYANPDPMYPLRSRVYIYKSGNAGNPITYHGNGLVIVEGASAANDIDYCMFLYNVQYVIVDGFTCRSAYSLGNSGSGGWKEHYGMGVGMLLDMCNNCDIKNCISYNNHDTGISVGKIYGLGTGEIDGTTSRGTCNNNNITHNICYDNGRVVATEESGEWGSGITVFGNDNAAHQGWGPGGGWGDMIPDQEWSNNNNVRYNYCYGNRAKGIGMIGYGASNYIEFNICYNNGKAPSMEGAGIVIFRNCGNATTYIRHNTVYGHTFDGRPAIGYACGIVAWDTWSGDCGVKNCIVTGNARGIKRGNQDFYADAGLAERGYNNVWGNTIDYDGGCAALPWDTWYNPQYRTIDTGIWDTSFILKCKYNPVTKTLSGDNLTSPCVDHSSINSVFPDWWWDRGAHSVYSGTPSTNGGQIGYPDPPSNLGKPAYVSGLWNNYMIASLEGQADLSDPVEPDEVERIRYLSQVSYEKSFASGGNIVWVTGPSNWSIGGSLFPVTVSWVSATLPALPGCGEGQFHWRIYCEDNVNFSNSGNISSWSYGRGVEGNDLIAFGIDLTKPLVVNNLSAVGGAATADLSWTDIADSPPTYTPGGVPPPGYKRQSDMATYNIYRSTFDYVNPPYNEDTWRAQVIACGGMGGNSGRFNIPWTGPVGNNHTWTDAGPLTGGQTYYYYICGIDNAGNEAPLSNRASCIIGAGGATFEYIIGDSNDGAVGRKAPCWGTSVPNNSQLSVAISASTTTCDLSFYSNANYQIGDDHLVRHYARISTGAGANLPEVRFYYTVGTRRQGYIDGGVPGATLGLPEVFTNVDENKGRAGTQPLNSNKYINGTIYVPVGGGAPGFTYFYADIPLDIHACGDQTWDANKPWGTIGVRISGHTRYDGGVWPLPSADGKWTNESPGTENTYTYYVRTSGGVYKAVYPGNRDNELSKYSFRHVQNELLQPAATALTYFRPNGNAGVDSFAFNANRFTVTAGDGKYDIFYGEKPDLYVRLIYGDGTPTASYAVYRSSTTAWNSGWVLDNVAGQGYMVAISTTIINGINNDASDSFAGGFASQFYGHFGYMKTKDTSKLAFAPESGNVRYYFELSDGIDLDYFGQNVANENQPPAQASLFWYYILQDDYTRPYVSTSTVDASALRPSYIQNISDSGNCSWTNWYQIKANLWDMNNGDKAWDNPAGTKLLYANMIQGRGANSGIYHNPTSSVTGAAQSPVHDTRVYYKITNDTPATRDGYQASDKYLTGNSGTGYFYIAENVPENNTYDENDSNNDGLGYVQLNGPASGGEWTSSIPLKESYIGQYLYYRIFACNNDFDPQAFISPSANYINAGAPVLGAIDAGGNRNNHGVVGQAVSDPYDTNFASHFRDDDRDHGWVMYTRYGGMITSPKMVRVKAKVTIGGITKVVNTYLNAEGGIIGNVLYTEIEKGP